MDTMAKPIYHLFQIADIKKFEFLISTIGIVDIKELQLLRRCILISVI